MATQSTPNSLAVNPQAPAVMAPAAKALHLEARPEGIAVGPSAQELMLIIEQMQAQLNVLASRGIDVEAARAPQETVEKEYFHQTPGSNIVVSRRGPRGEHIPETVFFDFRGSLITSDPVVQEFLDEIADRPGVPVYTHKAPLVSPDAKAAADQVVALAAKSIDKLGAEARTPG